MPLPDDTFKDRAAPDSILNAKVDTLESVLGRSVMEQMDRALAEPQSGMPGQFQTPADIVFGGQGVQSVEAWAQENIDDWNQLDDQTRQAVISKRRAELRANANSR